MPKTNTDLPINQIVCGNCVEVMKTFPDESIDCIVTDPPYGIGFMGKDWDKALPPKEAFEQMFRVLKHGALAFVMSSPRQDVLWRMLQMLESCGFQLRQSFISWIYKTGFPKAYDVSLGIDKKFLREEFIAEHGRKPTKEELKELLKEKRKIIGKNLNYRNPNTDHHKRWNDAVLEPNISLPATEEAKKWEGWKSITGLKPALECILMVNKPLGEKTIADNVLKHGTGAINVDACRIPFEPSSPPQSRGEGYPFLEPEKGWNQNYLVKTEYKPDVQGRFPANLLVSDKALDTGKMSKSGKIEPHHLLSAKKNQVYGKYNRKPAEEQVTYGDMGDQSRYFDLDAWALHHGFLDVPKASKSERDAGLENLKPKKTRAKMMTYANNESGRVSKGFEMFKTQPKRNTHPTVKPIKLMAYLIELGCPKDGVVLDPFVGSGTSCMSAQKLGRKWIGIDDKLSYVELAKARLRSIPEKLDKFLADTDH